MAGASDWILAIVLGGLLGMIGQGIRAVIGLKKMEDMKDQANGANQEPPKEAVFDGRRLGGSLLIGAVAGSLAALSMDAVGAEITKDTVLALLASGYSGADFIEGAMKRVRLPGA